MPTSLTLRLDDYELDEFVSLASNYGDTRFDYVVTPNVDHIIRYYDDAQFRELYAHAAWVLLDSRLMARILNVTRALRPRVCPGSDLTARLFSLMAPRDRIVLIGSGAEQAQRLAQRYGLQDLRHFSPPMGFIRDPAAIEQTLHFIETHAPFRFCFLAVGSPQQEILARRLQQRGTAHGLALCIGASVNFLTGVELRAPRWMQLLNLEWLYRLLQDPRRLARRYLVRGPRIFVLLPRLRFELRRSTAASGKTASQARSE
ncbi:MAG TPA: WecB/TagA/CpsF family glycosyltransferase [Steroidobacteraceae bacterium]